MFKDANTADLIKKCSDTAYNEIVKSYEPTNYNKMYSHQINLDAANLKVQEFRALESNFLGILWKIKQII